jgi:hypothetical protein
MSAAALTSLGRPVPPRTGAARGPATPGAPTIWKGTD